MCHIVCRLCALCRLLPPPFLHREDEMERLSSVKRTASFHMKRQIVDPTSSSSLLERDGDALMRTGSSA